MVPKEKDEKIKGVDQLVSKEKGEKTKGVEQLVSNEKGEEIDREQKQQIVSQTRRVVGNTITSFVVSFFVSLTQR